MTPDEPDPEAALRPKPHRGAPRRWRDLALVLPALGFMLLMPPLITLPAAAGSLFGLPSGVVYVFGLWAVLIALAARMSGPLGRGSEQ